MSGSYIVVWSGALHRQNERQYSLLGEGWVQKEPILVNQAPARDAFPSRKDIANAKLIPADDLWRLTTSPDSRKCRCGRPMLNKHRKQCAICAGKQQAAKVKAKRAVA
jgi:hypothetical protein